MRGQSENCESENCKKRKFRKLQIPDWEHTEMRNGRNNYKRSEKPKQPLIRTHRPARPTFTFLYILIHSYTFLFLLFLFCQGSVAKPRPRAGMHTTVGPGLGAYGQSVVFPWAPI